MSEFFYRSGPNEFGPLSEIQLRKLASGGQIVAGDEIRRGRSGNWIKAATLEQLFNRPQRVFEQAINEMDVMPDLRHSGRIETSEVFVAKRDTAFDSDTGEDVAPVRISQNRSAIEQKPRERPVPLHVSAAGAIAVICHLAAVLGVVLGVFSLLGANNFEQQILGCVCFMLAIIALAAGCALQLLLEIRGRSGSRSPV